MKNLIYLILFSLFIFLSCSKDKKEPKEYIQMITRLRSDLTTKQEYDHTKVEVLLQPADLALARQLIQKKNNSINGERVPLSEAGKSHVHIWISVFKDEAKEIKENINSVQGELTELEILKNTKLVDGNDTIFCEFVHVEQNNKNVLKYIAAFSLPDSKIYPDLILGGKNALLDKTISVDLSWNPYYSLPSLNVRAHQ